MKLQTTIWKLGLLGLVLVMTGCGSKDAVTDDAVVKPQNPLEDFSKEEENEEPEKEIDYTEVYKEVLAEYQKFINSGEESDFAVSTGALEAVMGLGSEEALKSIGYTIEDMSGDDIPELLIGEVSEEENGFGTMIYALYNCTNGTPECTFEGWYRNAYHWMGDGSFTYGGSASAICSMFGTAALSEDGTALEWQEYYFTHEKDENFEEIGCYYNTTGEVDVAASEELDISLDEFWDMETEILEKRQWMELTPFSEMTDAEAPKEEADQETGLEGIRGQIAESGDVCAVAYLGFFDGAYEDLEDHFIATGLINEYSFLSEIEESHFIAQEGYELYVVVPVEKESHLIVNEHLMNEIDYSVGPGNELGRFQDGKPVLLCGNISEIVPNLYFEMENPDGSFIAYTPSLSLRDGSLYALNGICDITPYELLGIEKEEWEEADGSM